MTIGLEFVVPPADLADRVSLFYHFRVDAPQFADVERAGHAQLRFRLAGSNSEYGFPDGSIRQVGGVHLIGPTTGPSRVSVSGPVEVVGVGLNPAGWSALVRSDASAMVNRAIDCDTMFDGIAAVGVAMQAAPDTAAKVAIAVAFVRQAMAGAGHGAVGFVQQVDAWLAAHTSPALETLEAATGLSRRQVERRCNALYGAPPKVLARKYRALRAAVALVTEGESTAELLARGFYDQSHLIREVKQFAGMTPRRLRTERGVLTHLSVGGRAALRGKVGPLVSET